MLFQNFQYTTWIKTWRGNTESFTDSFILSVYQHDLININILTAEQQVIAKRVLCGSSGPHQTYYISSLQGIFNQMSCNLLNVCVWVTDSRLGQTIGNIFYRSDYRCFSFSCPHLLPRCGLQTNAAFRSVSVITQGISLEWDLHDWDW